MAKIDRLQARKQTEKRQRRIGKQTMKDAGFTRKEIKQQKLQSKADATLKEARRVGELGTSKGINKMKRLGVKYNRQVTRGYGMELGSKEIAGTQNIRESDKKTLNGPGKNVVINMEDTPKGPPIKPNSLSSVVANNPIGVKPNINAGPKFKNNTAAGEAANLLKSGKKRKAARTLSKAAKSGISYGPSKSVNYLKSQGVSGALLGDNAGYTKKDIRKAKRNFIKG